MSYDMGVHEKSATTVLCICMTVSAGFIVLESLATYPAGGEGMTSWQLVTECGPVPGTATGLDVWMGWYCAFTVVGLSLGGWNLIKCCRGRVTVSPERAREPINLHVADVLALILSLGLSLPITLGMIQWARGDSGAICMATAEAIEDGLWFVVVMGWAAVVKVVFFAVCRCRVRRPVVDRRVDVIVE